MNAVDDTGVRLGIGALDRIDSRSRLLGADSELGDDPYVYLRDAYLEPPGSRRSGLNRYAHPGREWAISYNTKRFRPTRIREIRP